MRHKLIKYILSFQLFAANSKLISFYTLLNFLLLLKIILSHYVSFWAPNTSFK